MAKQLKPELLKALRADARRLEAEASARSEKNEPYPKGTNLTRPNQPSRMFNVRLTDEQYGELQQLAEQKHLPMSTMARAWLLDRLEAERRAG